MAYEKNVNFTPGILSGYQKYEGLAGLWNEFNEFYTSVASKLVSKIKTKSWTQNNQIQCSCNPQRSQKLKIIKSIDSSKSSDIYDIYVTKIPENTLSCNIWDLK